jgi:hypothetical protein
VCFCRSDEESNDEGNGGDDKAECGGFQGLSLRRAEFVILPRDTRQKDADLFLLVSKQLHFLIFGHDFDL